MLEPHCRSFDIAIIVCLRVENEDVELLFVEKAKFGGRINTLDRDLMASLCDICLKVVIVQTFSSQTELSESTFRDLYENKSELEALHCDVCDLL